MEKVGITLRNKRIDDGLYQLASQPEIGSFLRQIIDLHKNNDPGILALGNGIIEKLKVFNDSL